MQDRLRAAVLRSAERRLANGFAAWAGATKASITVREDETAACKQVGRGNVMHGTAGFYYISIA